MPRGVAHSDETKAAVRAALLAGSSPAEVARQFGLDKSVVSRWKDQIPEPQLQLVATEKAEAMDGLVRDYLRANLKALTTQCVVAGDESYIRRYPPQQLAILHGVMADKVARIAEIAAGAGGRKTDAEEEDDGEPEATGGKIVVEYFDDTTSTSAFGAGADQD